MDLARFMAPHRNLLAVGTVVLVLTAAGPVRAQAPPPAPAASEAVPINQPDPAALAGPAAPGAPAAPGPGTTVFSSSSSWVGTTDGQSSAWVASSTASESINAASGWFVGADFLLVRPHFSEATAFARGTEGASSLHITAQDLDFDYNASFRVFAGYRFEGTDTELRFTYTRLTDDTQAEAGNFSAGHFAVDPFGNVAGTAVVVDPNSAQFGKPIVGGDHIEASANVDVNVFDLDVVKPLLLSCGGWVLKYTAGVRIARVHESYDSVITESGAFFSGGEYIADFTGAGPRLGFQALRYFGRCRQFSVYANTSGSLLVGDYNMHFGQTTTSPPFNATQDTNDIRVLPVVEAEIGSGWSPLPWLNVSAGWLFQAWFDLGGSGGTFGNFYTVTENANIMAFEGFTLRAELTF